jgi:hypothetical protein
MNTDVLRFHKFKNLFGTMFVIAITSLPLGNQNLTNQIFQEIVN